MTAEGEELVDLFAKKMLNLANPIARNVGLEVTNAPGLQFSKLYGANNISVVEDHITATVPDLLA